jgi:hypothetical protein
MEGIPSKLNPALIGGAVIGVLSSIPLISAGNCLCCMWVLLGGGIAAYLYRKDFPPEREFTMGEGAVVGLIAGLFGALFTTLLTYFFEILGLDPGQEFLRSFIESRQDLSPELKQFFDSFQDGGGMEPMFVFIGLFFSIIIDSIFGTLGGLLGTAILGKRK